ncbi:hypothetical protein B0T22DRAFT_264153 [Podospora appendiculata]|uniref:Uncharacterized protein n=1 Tax=Podospora appendiculata TaxID=314037 RepID=A0AAE0X2Y8_9PEZI|nr:hypothetical protein B0T22DRAFT_264153 [Podospora appendiculata]
MPSFDRMYGSSPVLAMPLQAVHQDPFNKQFLQHQASSFGHLGSWPQQLVRTSSVAGRKRSRDEAAVNLDPPEKVVESPAKEAEDEWIYGPGMVLIKKTNGYVADASSQSGTWIDVKKAEQEAREAEAAQLVQDQLAQDRPSLRNHKSQRLSTPNLNGRDSSTSRHSSPTRDMSNPMTASSDSIAQPIVDDFTFHLGIGWSRISEHIEAAARGWARYIENHYPVTNAKILLESRGLQSYLVESTEGYFLFAENLRQGRMVSKTADGALQNLKSSPPVFDGPATLVAVETPKPSDSTSFFALPTPITTVDMDMS